MSGGVESQADIIAMCVRPLARIDVKQDAETTSWPTFNRMAQ